MILGILGKGGSGKSSVATQLVLSWQENNKNILAIDADHNMDLIFNLTGNLKPQMPYLGTAMPEIENFVGLNQGEEYNQIFIRGTEQRFKFIKGETDSFTEKYSSVLNQNIRIMAAGPQTDQVLYGQKCGHVLATPLKVYLPLLEISSEDVVILDEKAGADGVTTGIVTGIDMGVIVCEPSLHSIKAAQQIAELLNFYDTPYFLIGNKINEKADQEFIASQLGFKPLAFFTNSNLIKRQPGEIEHEWSAQIRIIKTQAEKHYINNRLERTIKKFKRNHQFKSTKT